MAKKLSDDHLRIILDIEAKGVQSEFQKIASSTIQLTDANKRMAKEMKDAEKQMKASAKEMAHLEKVGQTTSNAYKEARGTFNGVKVEIADYKEKIKQNTKAIEENNKKHIELIQTAKIEDLTMSQLRQRAEELKKQLDNTSASLSPEAYKKLQNELGQVNNRMSTVQNTGKGMLSQFSAMHNPVGSAARAVQGFGQALKLLLANPVVAIIAGIVLVFYALREALFKNEEAMSAINRIMAPMKVLFDAIVHLLQKLVVAFLNFVEGAISGISKLLEKLPFVGKYMKDINEKAQAGIQLEKDKQALEKRSRENMVENAKKETQITKLRNEAKRKDLYTDQQRLDKLNEAVRLEKEITAIKVEEAKETLRLLELESARTKSSKELLQKIAEAKVAVESAENEQYTHTMRVQSEISSTMLEIQRERAEAAKKAMENHLKEIDRTLDFEINQLKKSRAQGLLTEIEYNDKVEELTLSSLKKKMDIKGQEKHQLIKYQSDILDAEIKHNEKADKNLLEALTKTKEQKLRMLDASKNKALEILQEEESDQKIYALRSAAIESEHAQMRLDTIRAFGQAVEQAEFNNAKTRQDAIDASNEEIIKAEESILNEQAKLRKLFARSTADFERQYHIKTLDQRKEDELRILEKQYNEKLLSEETYQLALKSIEKKYEDERLKIREQYGIVSIKELYNNEIEILKEKNRQGLIEGEAYEQAMLQIKLKYAQEYASKVGEFAKIGSDTVKAMEESQTAKLDAEYTKRQSALTEQYNHGILSQEEYNSRKEELDYEQKVKELEIQKKYADVNFAMQASEIISSGAVAAINAYKALAGIPIVGPGLGAVAAALVAVTTTLQLSRAKAERDRVKAMTLESPGGRSGGTGPLTGSIRLKEGFAEGGLNADLTSGGYTGPGRKYDVAGYVPVHHGEYIIAREELQQPAIMSMARAIERERRKRTGKNATPGFAEGGSNTSDDIAPAAISSNGRVMSRLLAVLQRLESGDIVVNTNYGITELEAEQRKKQEAELKFTIKS